MALLLFPTNVLANSSFQMTHPAHASSWDGVSHTLRRPPAGNPSDIGVCPLRPHRRYPGSEIPPHGLRYVQRLATLTLPRLFRKLSVNTATFILFLRFLNISTGKCPLFELWRLFVTSSDTLYTLNSCQIWPSIRGRNQKNVCGTFPENTSQARPKF